MLRRRREYYILLRFFHWINLFLQKVTLDHDFIAFFPLDQPIDTKMVPNLDFIALFLLEQLPTAFGASTYAKKLHFIAFFHLDQPFAAKNHPNP